MLKEFESTILCLLKFNKIYEQSIKDPENFWQRGFWMISFGLRSQQKF